MTAARTGPLTWMIASPRLGFIGLACRSAHSAMRFSFEGSDFLSSCLKILSSWAASIFRASVRGSGACASRHVVMQMSTMRGTASGLYSAVSLEKSDDRIVSSTSQATLMSLSTALMSKSESPSEENSIRPSSKPEAVSACLDLRRADGARACSVPSVGCGKSTSISLTSDFSAGILPLPGSAFTRPMISR